MVAGRYHRRRIAATSWAIAPSIWAQALISKQMSVVVMVTSLSPRAGCAMDEEAPANRTSLPGTGRMECAA